MIKVTSHTLRSPHLNTMVPVQWATPKSFNVWSRVGCQNFGGTNIANIALCTIYADWHWNIRFIRDRMVHIEWRDKLNIFWWVSRCWNFFFSQVKMWVFFQKNLDMSTPRGENSMCWLFVGDTKLCVWQCLVVWVSGAIWVSGTNLRPTRILRTPRHLQLQTLRTTGENVIDCFNIYSNRRKGPNAAAFYQINHPK